MRTSKQRESTKSLGYVRKTFTKAQMDRMFAMRADGASNAAIGRRFGCSDMTVARLIGKKGEAPEVFCAP